jgi:hypothetical protein
LGVGWFTGFTVTDWKCGIGKRRGEGQGKDRRCLQRQIGSCRITMFFTSQSQSQLVVKKRYLRAQYTHFRLFLVTCPRQEMMKNHHTYTKRKEKEPRGIQLSSYSTVVVVSKQHEKKCVQVLPLCSPLCTNLYIYELQSPPNRRPIFTSTDPENRVMRTGIAMRWRDTGWDGMELGRHGRTASNAFRLNAEMQIAGLFNAM